MKKPVYLSMVTILAIIGLLWSACTNELTQFEESYTLDSLKIDTTRLNGNVAEPVDENHSGDPDSVVHEEEVAKTCEEMFLKDYASFPVGVSYGNEQNKPETQGIILNEASQITTTHFFTTFIMRGEYDLNFSSTDAAVNFATQHGKKIHGHCLIYGMDDVNPGWLRSFRGNNHQFEELIKHFITNTLSRYKGRVRGYDVANELFTYMHGGIDQTWIRRRFSSDQEYLDFIARCFHYAHQADPNAVLFYNDYGHEFSNNNFEKARAIVDQVNKWKRAGVPVHGIGLQVHTNIFRPIEHIERALELAVSTGLQVHISELDISINYADWDINGVQGGVKGLTYANESAKQQQREMYRKVVEAYKKVVPPSQQYGITLWDLCDKYSWLNWNRFEAGTLFDENYRRKPAFYGFLEGLTGNRNECN